MNAFPAPFDGAISKFYESDFPKELRKRLEKAKAKEVLSTAYPYEREMKRGAYEDEMAPLQIELQKLQRWVKETDARVLVLFEGRDAAGKGGTIKRIVENLNPRGARIVALSKPSDVERGQWYFQRYVAHLPSPGEISLFDRSWYNRAGVETVMGFCDEAERDRFFVQAPAFERMLVEDGVILLKIFLSVGRAEQMARFLKREKDPLKHWKLSPIDVAALAKWDDYSAARDVMFARTHTPEAPWRVIRADCKKRARLAAIRLLLQQTPYALKEVSQIDAVDSQIVIAPSELQGGEE
ncbi:MAG: polyphosphate kinase 2 [Rhodobacteraceae bacterium]|nr:polyphosphate kinase 2 [Paracoccaceae bacterium]